MAIVTVADTNTTVALVAAERIAALIEGSIRARSSATVCLAGGRTPAGLYDLLADDRHPWRHRIDWTRVHLFWGDERHVPPDHPDSNFGMAYRTLVSRVPIPLAQVYRIEGEREDARDAATEYEATLRNGLIAAGRTDQSFDVALLGIGQDGHIASIFPGSPTIDERSRRVAAAWVPHLQAWRITLTPPALLNSRHIVVLASGEEKAGAVRAALVLPEDPSRWPAQLLRPAADRVEWIIDAAASRSLAGPPA